MTARTKKAGLYRDTGGWVRVAFPFDRVVSDTLKIIVGRGNYRYDGPDKGGPCWFVLEPYAQDAANVLLVNGYEVETDLPIAGNSRGSAPAAPSSSNGTASNPFAALFQVAGTEKLAHAIYRALIKVLHPDVGGSNILTQQLNDAWSEYEQSNTLPF